MDVKYPEIEVRLSGKDSNAFTLIGIVARELRKNDVSEKEVNEFYKEAMSKDYNHLLQTCMKWVTVS